MIQLNPQKRLTITNVVFKLKEHSQCFSLEKEREENHQYPSDQVILVKVPPSPEEPYTVGNRSLEINRKCCIGKGRFSTVFKGKFEGKEVAVKRVQLMDVKWHHETEYLSKLDHPNVVDYIYYENDDDFGYTVLELCNTSMEKLFLKDGDPKKYKGPLPTDEQVLFQLASGLDYIHSKNIVHRDIKPEHVLVSSSIPVQMKWVGFSISKKVNKRGSCTMWSGLKGTKNWIAPELLLDSLGKSNADWTFMRFSTKIDIFSAGCVFSYFLLQGVHPFGSHQEIGNYIIKGNPVNLKKLPEKHFARSFIERMIDYMIQARELD